MDKLKIGPISLIHVLCHKYIYRILHRYVRTILPIAHMLGLLAPETLEAILSYFAVSG